MLSTNFLTPFVTTHQLIQFMRDTQMDNNPDIEKWLRSRVINITCEETPGMVLDDRSVNFRYNFDQYKQGTQEFANDKTNNKKRFFESK